MTQSIRAGECVLKEIDEREASEILQHPSPLQHCNRKHPTNWFFGQEDMLMHSSFMRVILKFRITAAV
ncbi:MAG: hypothetical protein Ct9H90mP9_0020 [Pseudomonadota bacterium]|nr:MAG: hypothetical protein Ct9H90mP9_0020 [Pseudomonadota bacterium]